MDKEDLLHTFHENRAAILACARTWPPDKVGEVFLGEWSLLDLLAHMSGWDEANRAAVSAVQAGRLPEFYAHKDPDWRTFNAELVRKYRQPSLPQQINLVNQTLDQLETCLSQVDAVAFFKDYGVRYRGYKVIISRLVESDMKDVRVHLEQMNAWLTSTVIARSP
jgi:hypothetical protein